MSKFNIKKKYILILLIITIIIICFLFVIQKRTTITDIPQRVLEGEQEIEKDKISCIIYDNTQEKLKILVTIQRENGIDSIQYKNSNGQNKKINGNGKTKVSIDLESEIDTTLEFEITSNNTSQIETITIDENKIKQDFKLISTEENGIKKVEIQDNRDIQNKTIYYKIGNDNTIWEEYKEKFDIDISCIDIDDINNNNYKTTVYAKVIDKAGNTVITKEEFQVDFKGDFDIFKNAKVSIAEANLREYGITPSWTNSQTQNCIIGNLGAGHDNGSGSYSGIFTLDYSKLNKIDATELYIVFQQYSSGGGSWVASSITVNYADGTVEEKQVDTRSSGKWAAYPTTITLQKEKEISNIQFNIWRI